MQLLFQSYQNNLENSFHGVSPLPLAAYVSDYISSDAIPGTAYL